LIKIDSSHKKQLIEKDTSEKKKLLRPLISRKPHQRKRAKS